jgi:hypothetical protein
MQFQLGKRHLVTINASSADIVALLSLAALAVIVTSLVVR